VVDRSMILVLLTYVADVTTASGVVAAPLASKSSAAAAAKGIEFGEPVRRISERLSEKALSQPKKSPAVVVAEQEIGEPEQAKRDAIEKDTKKVVESLSNMVTYDFPATKSNGEPTTTHTDGMEDADKIVEGLSKYAKFCGVEANSTEEVKTQYEQTMAACRSDPAYCFQLILASGYVMRSAAAQTETLQTALATLSPLGDIAVMRTNNTFESLTQTCDHLQTLRNWLDAEQGSKMAALAKLTKEDDEDDEDEDEDEDDE